MTATLRITLRVTLRVGLVFCAVAAGGAPSGQQASAHTVAEAEPPLRTWGELARRAEELELDIDIELVKPDSERGRSILELSAGALAAVDNPRVVTDTQGRSVVEWRCATEAAAALYDAEQAFAQGDYSGARVGYRKVVRTDPQCYMAHAHLGDTFFREDNFAASIPHYSRAIEINPNDARSWVYRGHALLRVGQGNRAYDDFVEALALQPHFWLVERIVGHYADSGLVLNDLRILLPVQTEVESPGRGRVFILSAEQDPVALGPVLTIFSRYGTCQVLWQVESDSGARISAPPSAPSFDARREQECLAVALDEYLSVRTPATGTDPGFFDPTLDLLIEAREEGFLEQAVLYGVAGPKLAHLPIVMGPAVVASQRRFVERFVLLRETEQQEDLP